MLPELLLLPRLRHAPSPDVAFAMRSADAQEPARRDKCSLAFILAATQHSDDARFEGGAQYHTPTTARAAAASFSDLTPTHEQLKIKRRAPKSLGVKREHSEIAVAPTDDARPAKKGSKFCVVDGCGSRAKHARKCWKHGGSVKCKVPDCVNRAKTKGVCWSHGGGTICSFAQCATISVSNGVCWAHGGGKRCAVDGCSRPAYERTANLCTLHFDGHRKLKNAAP